MGAFRMPSLGADMEAGTVSRWLVKPGDEVRKGDVVAVVDTEKSTIEVEIFESGVIDSLVVPEGEQVPVGTVLAQVRAPGVPAAAVPAPAPAVPAAAPAPGGAEMVHSPVVRHLAERLGVDLAAVVGSGPGGAVTRADVERAAAVVAAPQPEPVAAGAVVEPEPEPEQESVAAAAAAVPEQEPERVAAGAGAAPRPAPAVARVAPAPAGGVPRIRSSPRARRLAAELGVDLVTVAGTGPGAAVVERDLRRGAPTPAAPTPAAAPQRQAPPAAAAADRQANLRRAIGNLMARSKREIPHYYLSTTVDLAAASAWLEAENLRRPVTGRLVMSVLLLKAAARAVARVPEMNGFFAGDAFTPSDAVHVGVAVSLRSGGVIAPAIHDADRLDLDELMSRLTDLVGRARAGNLRASEMSDPTITVTNLGDLGVEAVFGVIYPPQVALVGFGRVVPRPVARDGMVGVRPCVTATLSADHRVSDGLRGGRYLAEVARLLDEPEKL